MSNPNTVPDAIIGGATATGGSIYQYLSDPVALLAGIEKILEATKERESSTRIITDVKALVQELSAVTSLYDKSRAQLDTKSKEIEHLKQLQKVHEENEVAFGKLKENFENHILAEESSRKAKESAVQSLADANQKNAEAHAENSKAISNWVTVSQKLESELSLSRQREQLSAESHELARKIWEKEKKELEEEIRDLTLKLARNPRLSVAAGRSDNGEKLKRLQKDKETLKLTIIMNTTERKKKEALVKKRKDELKDESLSKDDKPSVERLLGNAEKSLLDHQEVCQKDDEKLLKIERAIKKELQKQNTASSSATGANSQWSAETGATTNTSLTKTTSENPEKQAKDTTDTAK